jgi:hypothetical protein
VREKYCWLVAGGWFVLREKYCWLVADKPNEQAVDCSEHGQNQPAHNAFISYYAVLNSTSHTKTSGSQILKIVVVVKPPPPTWTCIGRWGREPPNPHVDSISCGLCTTCAKRSLGWGGTVGCKGELGEYKHSKVKCFFQPVRKN